jgi:PAS domain S-box-containing protein
MSETFAHYDTDLRAKWVNRAAADSVGETAEALVGRYCYEFWYERIEPCEVCHVLAALETGEMQESRVSTPDGRVWAMKSYPVFDKAGTITGMVELGQDITQRVQAKQALQEERDRAQKYLDVARVIFVVLDAHGEVTLINPQGEAVLGYKQEEILGKNWFDNFVPVSVRDQIKRGFKSLMAGGVMPVESYENPILTRGGGERIVIWHTTVLKDEDGNIAGALSSGEDITERKQAEEALRRSQERLARAQQVAHLGCWELDLTTEEIEWSDEIYRICGLEPGEVEPTHELGMQIIHPEDRAMVKQVLREAIERAARYDLEMRIVRPDGAVRYVHSLGEVTLNQAGRPVRLMGSFLDITERKQAELTAQRYAAELERSNQELEQYAYVLSHDLRQPVRTVTGFLNLLERRYGERLDAKGVELLQFAAAGARQLGGMVHGLLDLSRVTTRGRPFTPVDTESLLQEVLDLLHVVIEERGAQITYDRLPVVPADERQLRQVFQNLVENGTKFQRAGTTPQVHVTARRQDRAWLFCVQDNGIGLDPDEAGRIFDVFQRLHTIDEYEGMGIGLALCKKIIRRHGGRIWVESQPGAGTTFYFTLPVDRPAGQEQML